MLQIAICDDVKEIVEDIKRIIISNKKEFETNIKIDKYNSGRELLENMANNKVYDLIFLDIEMAGMDGIEVGQQIRTIMADYETNIIIVSGNRQYALKACEIMPLAFITKPFKEDDIISGIKKGIIASKNKEKYLTYSINKDTHRQLLKDIYYFESDQKEVKMVLNSRTIKFYKTINSLAEELAPFGFYRISKSIIVNGIHVTSLEGYNITLKNNSKVKAGKIYTEALFDIMMEGGI